jgi:hypothetical protein
LPILLGHALNASANANINHARLDGIGNIHTGHETRTALSVQTLDGGRDRETGSEGSSTELGSTTSWGEDGTNGDILNESRIDLGALEKSLECAEEQIGGHCVLEASLSALGEGSS